jgi:hypothetical protein
VPLTRLPGWEPDSWAYHGDDGHSFCCQSSGKHYGPPFTAGDIIGCGVNFRTGSAFFTKNGDHLGLYTSFLFWPLFFHQYLNNANIGCFKEPHSARLKGSSFLR